MSSPTLQPDHRAALWNATLDAEMNVCYWTLVRNRAITWDRRLRMIIALTSGTAVASLSIWTRLPHAWQFIALLTFVATVIQTHYFSSETLRDISGLVATWRELAIDYDLLWEKFDDLSAVDSWKEYETTKRRERSIDESGFKVDDKLREEAYQQVLRKRGLA